MSDETKAYDQSYATQLGRLVSTLANLELNLRVALYLMDTPKEQRRSPSWRIADLKAGDEIEESWLSCWAHLSELIGAYNERQAAKGFEKIDVNITDLRNALAHGQITSPDEHQPFTLIKYAKPRESKVKVEQSHLLTLEWFSEQLKYTTDAMLMVNRRLQQLR